MNIDLNLILTLGTALVVASSSFAVKPIASEHGKMQKWSKAHFGNGKQLPTEPPPFSFFYGGKPSSEFITTWTTVASSKKLSQKRTERTVVYTDTKTGLVVTCIAIEYGDYPTVEWTLKFKNAGKQDSPILSDIKPLDLHLTRTQSSEFKLHWNTPDDTNPHSYEPHVGDMGPNTEYSAVSTGGRPTSGGYPFWNIEFDGWGQIVVFSWGGQWSALHKRDTDKGFSLKAGQELTHFVLHPGEEVSSPQVVTQFYQGDWIRSQNIWRRWMLAYDTPHVKGMMPDTMFYSCSNGYGDNLRSTIDFEKQFIDKHAKLNIGIKYWDLDAGWYPCDPVGWWKAGTWEPDKTRYPKGVKEESDYLHSYGIKLILWFEPERVFEGTWLALNRPDWIYGGDKGGLYKLGHPDAWKWMVDRVDSLIKSEGVDVYRQDFNMEPLGAWRANDVEDRQGITEIRHVEAYYAYWDELVRRNPGLLIDTCASGGRRNNLETLRRSVPILRTDAVNDPVGNQGHTYGMAQWVPIYGTGLEPHEIYNSRSAMCPIFGMVFDIRKEGNEWDRMIQMAKEWKVLSKCMLGDYYPLTPYSLDKKDWMAMQWDVPEKGKGAIQVFRHDETPTDSIVLKLQRLDAEAKYEVKNFDLSKSEIRSGSDLMKLGVKVVIGAKPGAAILSYRKVK